MRAPWVFALRRHRGTKTGMARVSQELPVTFDRASIDEGLERIFKALIGREAIEHAVLAIESGDGTFKRVMVGGKADPSGRRFGTDTPYFTASVTKMYIATAVLKLYERKEIELDRPVADYLPADMVRGLHRTGGVDHSQQIRVWHLLTHTSGVADWLEDRPRGDRSLVEEMMAGQEDRLWRIDEITRHVSERLTPHFAPQPSQGKCLVRYSDTNYQLLNALIEQVTRKPLHEAFGEIIYRPLGLERTFHLEASPSVGEAPAVLWSGGKPFSRRLLLQSFRDVFSTAAETIRFLRTLIHGDLFDDPATGALMQARWNRFGLPKDAASLRLPGWPIQYGAGMMRFELPRLFSPLRPLPAVIGHTGSTGSWLFYCPDLDLYFSGTVDEASQGPVPYRLLPQLLKLFVQSRRRSA